MDKIEEVFNAIYGIAAMSLLFMGGGFLIAAVVWLLAYDFIFGIVLIFGVNCLVLILLTIFKAKILHYWRKNENNN